MLHRKIVLSLLISAIVLLPAGVQAEAREPKLERLVRRVAELEARNAELEHRLRHYRNGLEQAVAELNRADTQPRPAGRASPQHPREPVIESGKRLLSRARAEVGRGLAVVRGSFRHDHRQSLSGTLVVELYRDGFKVDEVRRPFEVPAYESVHYRQVFELEGYAAGHYTARAGLLY